MNEQQYFVGGEPAVSSPQVFPGTVGLLYTAQLRIRLLAELKVYTGGTSVQKYVNKDGTPSDDEEFDIVKMVISDPAATYYLNAGEGGNLGGQAFLDYMLSVSIKGGATLTVTVDSVNSLTPRQIVLGQPALDKPENSAFDDFKGIFCQVDYDHAEVAPTIETVKSGGVRGFSLTAWGESLKIEQNEQ